MNNLSMCRACKCEISIAEEFCSKCQSVVDEIISIDKQIDCLMDSVPELGQRAQKIVYYFIRFIAQTDQSVMEWSHIRRDHLDAFIDFLSLTKIPVNYVNYCLKTIKEVYLMVPTPKQNFFQSIR
ncbi:hypothetical protein SDC9_162534 [bioreactor metagenome]|uniref:Uncharacterized protein n=1 Tax=bioreactor metagenome TaxID=1076179 RepID=A0A645FLC9_9ZZZZ